MQVSVVELPELKAIVLRTVANQRDVRQAWKEINEEKQGKLITSNKEYGYVFVPEWQWATHDHILRVGLEVDSYGQIPEGVETLTIPSRKFAKITVYGDRKAMDGTYKHLNRWFEEEGYERDFSEGSFSIEANRLIPVNPFDIPADVINHFDFDIYAPIKV